MSPETIQVLTLIINAVLIPAVAALARFLWRLDRRLYRIELKLCTDEKE